MTRGKKTLREHLQGEVKLLKEWLDSFYQGYEMYEIENTNNLLSVATPIQHILCAMQNIDWTACSNGRGNNEPFMYHEAERIAGKSESIKMEVLK